MTQVWPVRLKEKMVGGLCKDSCSYEKGRESVSPPLSESK